MNLFSAFAQTMPHMPDTAWWLAPVTIVLLGVLAAVDAFTAKVPDPLILPCLFLITGVQGLYAGWPYAGEHLAIAFAVAFLFYLANEIFFRATRRDAYGMGDVKWTMLAVACFGWAPGCAAWALGAWLGLAWMGLAKLFRRPIERVHFAPFLFFGLLAGIYYLRVVVSS
jgi:prepilin signal peptidase PulO-like enzyme (type II secretory pathway)